jgi:hypothetical protein
VARLRKRVDVEPVEERVPIFAEDVEVEEVEVVDPASDPGVVLTTPEGDLSVPLVAERLVVRKERVVVKRVIVPPPSPAGGRANRVRCAASGADRGGDRAIRYPRCRDEEPVAWRRRPRRFAGADETG